MSGGSIEGPAILEVMGHQRFTGRVSEAKVAGVSMLRIDSVNDSGDLEPKVFGPGAIYCITPISEELLQAEIDQRQRRKRLVEMVKAVNDAWRAAPDDATPESWDWCEHLVGSVIDREASEAERTSQDEPGWMVLVDGTSLYRSSLHSHWEICDW